MEKYGVNREQVEKLLKLDICKTEKEAIEKVATGEADALVKEAERKKDDG